MNLQFVEFGHPRCSRSFKQMSAELFVSDTKIDIYLANVNFKEVEDFW